MKRIIAIVALVALVTEVYTPSSRKGTEYYAERLLSQAIADPRVNALNRDEVRQYIEEEAEKLCIPPEETADYAMRGYEHLTIGDFKSGTAYSNAIVGSPQDSRSSNKEPPF